MDVTNLALRLFMITVVVIIGDCYNLNDLMALYDKKGIRSKRQVPGLPNGAPCYNNMVCASDCCLCADDRGNVVASDFEANSFNYHSCSGIGICVAETKPGQVCGLLSLDPWGAHTITSAGYGGGAGYMGRRRKRDFIEMLRNKQ